MVKVEVLAIGDELLDGRVVDTNGAHLARELRARGMALSRVTVVSDDVAVIAAELAAAGRRCDVVVCSGGLGPTDDDRTRDAAAAWLGEGLRWEQAAYEEIEAKFRAFGVSITPNNRRQAEFPQSAQVLVNEVGTAPAFFCAHPEGLRAWFLPGVPGEYRWLLERYVLPALRPEGEARSLSRRTMKFFGRGESALEHDLAGLALPEGVMLGYRAHFPEVHVTVSAWSGADGEGARAVEAASEAILGRLGRYLVAEGEEELAERVGRLLVARGERVTCAESCTGGMIAAMITEVAGSSRYFDAGYVTYANEAKERLVGVSGATLAAHGAVSGEVAVEMARGAQAASGAQWAVAVSGIAGPGGGSAEKPVGTVELALATPAGVWRRGLSLRAGWGRVKIRQASAHSALAMLLRALEGRLQDDPGVEGPY
jgi:nicotinamide-nucleotide amidase